MRNREISAIFLIFQQSMFWNDRNLRSFHLAAQQYRSWLQNREMQQQVYQVEVHDVANWSLINIWHGFEQSVIDSQ